MTADLILTILALGSTLAVILLMINLFDNVGGYSERYKESCGESETSDEFDKAKGK